MAIARDINFLFVSSGWINNPVLFVDNQFQCEQSDVQQIGSFLNPNGNLPHITGAIICILSQYNQLTISLLYRSIVIIFMFNLTAQLPEVQAVACHIGNQLNEQELMTLISIVFTRTVSSLMRHENYFILQTYLIDILKSLSLHSSIISNYHYF